jgi:hypothetical protein
MTSRPSTPDDEHIYLDGVKIKKTLTVTASVSGHYLGVAGKGYGVELVAEIDEAAGRYVTRRLTVEAHGDAEVTGEALRAIQVGNILRKELANYNGVPREEPADLLELGEAGPTTETLKAVARVYRTGMLLGDAPTQRVATAFGVPRSTAGRWVTRSRDRGFLTVTDPRSPRSADQTREQGTDG